MNERDIRYKCRDEYRQTGELDSPPSLTTEERLWWTDEAWQITKEEQRSSANGR